MISRELKAIRKFFFRVLYQLPMDKGSQVQVIIGYRIWDIGFRI
jgi:hypothetical protein